MTRDPGADGPPFRGAVRLLAWALALAAVAAAARAWLHTPEAPPERRLLARLARDLLRLQGTEGAFDPLPDDARAPEVLRTGPHALAAAALARTRLLGAEADVPGLGAALDRALDVLVARQRPGGGFGGMPPGRANPWPAVEACAAATLALALAGRPADRGVLRGALASLERTAAYPLREGWTRALVALALEAAATRGAGRLIGRDPRTLVAPETGAEEAACTDAVLAEAIVRAARDPGSGFARAVGRACGADPPVWLGARSDLRAWWMQAWLGARTGEARIAPAVVAALGEALEAPPEGTIPGGWFTDDVTQLACAVLALAEVQDPPPGGTADR